MKDLYLIPTSSAKTIPEDVIGELYEHTFNGILIQVKEDSESPMAWDAGFEVAPNPNGQPLLVIDGGAGPSGYGRCHIEVPLLDSPYLLSIEPMEDRTFQLGLLIDKLNQLGYEVTDKQPK